MTKPFDISKFRKSLTKSIPGISTGFHDPKIWISTGNYSLNKLISGEFDKGIPLGKVSMFGGESGSGKSLLCSGSIVKHAQQQGIYVVMIDSENALDEQWLKNLDVDVAEDKILRISAGLLDEVASILTGFMKGYKAEHEEKDYDDQPRVLIVIDSLGMLKTPTDIAQFEKGDMKGDMGRKAKALKALISSVVTMIEPYPIGVLCTNHTYASQDMFDPEDKMSGGSGPMFAASIVVGMKKRKLKETSGSDVIGIKAVCKIMKSRFSKPFETIDINIPYNEGLNLYAGLFDFLVNGEYITKVSAQKYSYKFRDGEEFVSVRRSYTDDILEKIVRDLSLSDPITKGDDENDGGSGNIDGSMDDNQAVLAEEGSG